MLGLPYILLSSCQSAIARVKEVFLVAVLVKNGLGNNLISAPLAYADNTYLASPI